VDLLPLSLIAIGLMVCLANWRLGVFLTLTVGFLQDPLRKIITDQPVWMQLGVGLFFLAAFGGCTMRFSGFKLSHVTRQHPLIARPLWAFIILSIVYLGITLVRYASIRLVGIGAFSYLFPMLALMLGFYFARKPALVQRYLLLHAVFTAIMGLGIYLDYFGVHSPLFEQVGQGIVLYGGSGSMKTYCGLFRASEIAGWHLGASICFLSVVAISSRRTSVRALAPIIILALAGAAVLTGRRKVLMLVMLYATFLGFALIYFRAKMRHGYAFVLLVGGLAASLATGRFFQIDPQRDDYQFYLDRSGTVMRDSPDRLRMLGIGSVYWSIQSNGFFGMGAGVAGQGSQYVGGTADVNIGAAEGGIGRIATEFGVPGLFVVTWLFIAIYREGWRLTRQLAAGKDMSSSTVVCLMAFLAANIPVFIVASQAYGDPFIIFTLSVSAGFVAGLSRPVLLGGRQVARKPIPFPTRNRARMRTVATT